MISQIFMCFTALFPGKFTAVGAKRVHTEMFASQHSTIRASPSFDHHRSLFRRPDAGGEGGAGAHDRGNAASGAAGPPARTETKIGRQERGQADNAARQSQADIPAGTLPENGIRCGGGASHLGIGRRARIRRQRR